MLQHDLPRPGGRVFVTDGGLETSLIYLKGLDLPEFASFPLVMNSTGRRQLDEYMEPYLNVAMRHHTGFIINTPTWRANIDWGAKLGFTPEALDEVNRRSVDWAKDLRHNFAMPDLPIVVDGAIGPRGDGYRADNRMSADEAEAYHTPQIRSFKEAGADTATAFTLTYSEEAIGIARAAGKLEMPLVISFTVETDGRLPSGESIEEAITRTDRESGAPPLYFMVNCAHPTHFETILLGGGEWTRRIGGIRPNASTKSHAELDAATELDRGNERELARHYSEIRRALPHLAVFGGCCGTDHRHVAAICEACLETRS